MNIVSEYVNDVSTLIKSTYIGDKHPSVEWSIDSKGLEELRRESIRVAES